MIRAVVVLFVVSALAGCDSYQPAAPSAGTPVPQPAPAPQPTAPLPEPVRDDNWIYLPAPPRPTTVVTDPIVGRYRLEITSRASSGLRCQQVPEHAKRRTYTADIDPFESYYAVRLYEATFLRDGARVGFGCSDRRLDMRGICHQFILRRDGDEAVSIEMVPEDEWRGAELWEVLIHETRLLQVHGLGNGTFRNGRIEATGAGGVWYGDGLPASDYAACGPGDIGWTFMRQ